MGRGGQGGHDVCNGHHEYASSLYPYSLHIPNILPASPTSFPRLPLAIPQVYAFGILMWEMYTAQRPYGNMKQQQLVEEVVMRGLRPKFPAHAPPAYIQLAQVGREGEEMKGTEGFTRPLHLDLHLFSHSESTL